MGMKLPFDQQCRAAGLPVPVPELPFHPDRSWRWDWSWELDGGVKLALEVQGVGSRTKDGRPTHGRHSRPAGMESDFEKIAEGILLGWVVLLATPRQAGSGQALEWVRRALEVLGGPKPCGS